MKQSCKSKQTLHTKGVCNVVAKLSGRRRKKGGAKRRKNKGEHAIIEQQKEEKDTRKWSGQRDNRTNRKWNNRTVRKKEKDNILID